MKLHTYLDWERQFDFQKIYTTKVKYEKQILIWEQPAVCNITSGIQKEQMSQLFYKDWTDDQLKFLVTKVW